MKNKSLWDLGIEALVEDGLNEAPFSDDETFETVSLPKKKGKKKRSLKISSKKEVMELPGTRNVEYSELDGIFDEPDEKELERFVVSDKVRLIEQFLLLKEEMVEYLVGKGYLSLENIYGRLPVEMPLTEYIKLTYYPKINDPYARYLIDKCIALHFQITENFKNYLKYKAEKLYAQHPDLQSSDDILMALTDAFRQGLDRSEPGYGNGSLVNFSYLRRWINQKIGRYLKKYKYSSPTVSFGDIEDSFDSERPAHFDEVYNPEEFEDHAFVSDSANNMPESSIEDDDFITKMFEGIKQHVLDEDMELLSKLNEVLENNGKVSLNAKQRLRLKFYLYGMGIFSMNGQIL